MTTKAKTVLITGSTDGVGRYVAERLAAQGWRVIVHGRDRTRGEAVVACITQQGGDARFLAADLASLAEVRSLSDVMLVRGYSGVRAYCQSKLAQILFTFDLAKELAGQNIAVNCLHPATYMDTTMVRLSGARPISTVEQGGAVILQLVDDPAFAGRSGLYFNGMQESRADRQAYDEDARRRLRRAELPSRGPPRSAGGPGQLGRNDLRCLCWSATNARLTGRRGIHRAFIAPHICW